MKTAPFNVNNIFYESLTTFYQKNGSRVLSSFLLRPFIYFSYQLKNIQRMLNIEKEGISNDLEISIKIPDEFIKEIINKSEDLTYEHYWEKYDLMMIDNRRFMHARRSYNKNDPRDIINIQTARASFGYKLTEKVFKNNKT